VALPWEIQQKARQAYRLWQKDPRHRSLRMKKVNPTENVWSVRIDREHRAVGVMKDNAIIWFWIGRHDDYERLLTGKRKT
jgi:Txe/YoeB family toxin of Txe-Axe toxin-antitoxin module